MKQKRLIINSLVVLAMFAIPFEVKLIEFLVFINQLPMKIDHEICGAIFMVLNYMAVIVIICEYYSNLYNKDFGYFLIMVLILSFAPAYFIVYRKRQRS